MALEKSILHCLLDEEPAAFHKADPTVRTFAVNLGFECRTTVARQDIAGDADATVPGHITLTADEAAAEALFTDFAKATETVRFHLFKAAIDPADPTICVLTEHRGAIAKQVSDTWDAAAARLVMPWLKDAAPDSGNTHYWTVPANLPGTARQEVATLDAGRVPATYRLRAAHAWNAPVAHRLQLTHILQPDLGVVDPAATESFVALPFFTAPVGVAISGKAQGDQWDFAYDPGGGLGEILCRTQIINHDGTPVETGYLGFVTPDGYLTVDPDAGNLWRVIAWLDARAASLMAPVQVLSGPGSGNGTDRDYDALFHWRYEMEGKTSRLNAPAPAWLAVTSLCASLDTIVLGIKKPVSGASSLGDILGPLAVDLFDAFQADIADRFGLADESCDLAALVIVLRSVLESGNAVLRPSDLTDPAERRRLADQLRHVHDIAVTEKERPLHQQLLDALLTVFSEAGSVPVETGFLDAIRGRAQDILKRALMEVEQSLQDEAGAEAAILRILETTERVSGRPLSTLFAEAYLAAIGRAGDAGLGVAVDAAFAGVWQQYRDRLQGPFNGAEAIRRSSGSEFSKSLLAQAEIEAALPVPAGVPVASSARLIHLVINADYYATRLLGPAAAPPPDIGLAVLAAALVRPLFPDVLPKQSRVTTPDDLRPFFNAAYIAALSPVAVVTDPAARFIPDTYPAPLPLQIAANVDGMAIDDFAASFNGLAVAIRRIDAGDDRDPWAHANLAELALPARSLSAVDDSEDPETTVPAALHPMLPTVSDGRGAMFIEYDGLPLAATTFRRTAAEAIAVADPALVPFYSHEAPDLSTSDFAKIPKLAYGRRFETFSFATTNAGALPLLLQGALPWMPKAEFKAPEKNDVTGPDLVSVVDYQRRTAIGQMAVNEKHDVNRAVRIGAPVAGVIPLADDYPRTVLAAFADSPGICDLFRDRSGDGTLMLPVDLAGEWQLPAPVFSGQPESLTVRLFNRAPTGPDDPGLAEVKVSGATLPDAPVDIRIGIRLLPMGAGQAERKLYLKVGDAVDVETTVPEIGPIEGWFRVTLTSKSSAVLSFAASDDLKPYETAAPLLLLSPDSNAWSGRLHEAVTVEIDTPRVGYLDFQRWFANGHSLADAFDFASEPENQAVAARLETALLTAYVLRDTDEDLARHLDRLPDPAVCAIRIQLAVEDQLVDLTQPGCLFRIVSLNGKLLEIARGLNKPVGGRWTPKLLKENLFLPLERAFRLSLSMEPGAFALLQVGPVVARVPEGLVARLSLQALVPARHFDGLKDVAGFAHPPVLHPGLKQHAAGVALVADPALGACFSYASAMIRIETMLDGMKAIAGPDEKSQSLKPAIRLAADMIAVRPVERARCYHLETRGDLPAGDDTVLRTRQWRLLGEIDITSQRWRPSGRPIYSHIDPAAFFDPAVLADAANGRAPHGAMPLGLQSHGDDLARFEQEAFFDRANIDSQTVTQRLLPLPSRTDLEQHAWEAPSATYFRHRFTLRSRYAGALKSPAGRAVCAWVTDRLQRARPADAWTLRVAMLADLSRVLLTRPQLRALIPLTMAPQREGMNTDTPPVLSIVQEPPFARGGLADRVAAEIKTGFGYGFEAPQPDSPRPSLEVLDSRKEIGPDPRLSYKALDEKTALGIALNVEGPMGLTFDQPNAPAPAFANSMLSLAPVQTSGTAIATEEHFLGVSMRRYIDPNWTMRAAMPMLDALDGARCWWIDHDVLQAGPLLGYRLGERNADLLTLFMDGDAFTIRVRKAAIDGGVAGAVEKDVAVCHWQRTFGSRIAILHQPVMPGHYATSVFVLPQAPLADVSQGRSNGPLLLCNFEWSSKSLQSSDDDRIGRTGQYLTLQSSGKRARPTMASAPTFLAWTRTGRNFDSIHMPLFEDPEKPSLQVRTAELLAFADAKASTLSFGRSGSAEQSWLCASTFCAPYPLHVHRHLAVLATRFLKEPGRPVEQYGRSALVLGKQSAALHGTAGPLDRARIVEFETPAAILCGSGDAVPQIYRKAYFDLVSTGFKQAAGNASVRMFFRFTGPAAHLRRFSVIRIDLFHDAGKQPHSVTVKLDNADQDQFAIGVELSIVRKAAQANLTYLARPLYSNGVFPDGVPVVAPDERGLHAVDNANPGLFASIVATGAAGAGEFWADVSLLHAPRADFDRGFDFDWLFSAPSSVGPAIDVTPDGLGSMVEAQARVVSVSPPFPIISVPTGK